jgi:hypothetical protein
VSEHTVFECDVTGERFGARNYVAEFDIKSHRSTSPFEIITRTIHLSDDALDRFDGMTPSGVEYIGVEDGEVVGAKLIVGTNDAASWEDRDSVLLDSYEGFFEYLESEVLD